jgi:regulatory protein
MGAGSMSEADDRKRAMELAFRALNTRDRTQQELRGFLERRRVGAPMIEEVVGDLTAQGFVDDVAYARRFADDRRLLDQWGSERIAQDLARRGVQRELIEGVLTEVGPNDELQVAVELLDRRYRVPFQGDRDRDKAWRMLVRRGYAAEIAYEAVRRHERGLADAA